MLEENGYVLLDNRWRYVVQHDVLMLRVRYLPEPVLDLHFYLW